MLHSHTSQGITAESPEWHGRVIPRPVVTPKVTVQPASEPETGQLEGVSYTYIRLQLDSYALGRELRAEIEKIGVECLEEGAPYEAYGIVSECERIVPQLLKLRDVQSVDRQEPVCSK